MLSLEGLFDGGDFMAETGEYLFIFMDILHHFQHNNIGTDLLELRINFDEHNTLHTFNIYINVCFHRTQDFKFHLSSGFQLVF